MDQEELSKDEIVKRLEELREEGIAAKNELINEKENRIDPLIAKAKDGDLDAINSLIELLEDTDLQIDAGRALVDIGEQAVEPLISSLKNEKSRIRMNAALALGYLKAKKAIRPLAEGLNDSDWEVRRVIVRVLGWIGGDEVIEPLNSALNDEREEVKEEAKFALIIVIFSNYF